MAIINYEQLERPIKMIEELLSEYDMEEKALILKQVNQRFTKGRQQQTMQESIGNIKFGGLMKKIMKDNKGDE